MEHVPFFSQVHLPLKGKIAGQTEKSREKMNSREETEAPWAGGMAMAATTARGGLWMGRPHLLALLRFGAYFGPRVLPVLGHFGPLLLSSLIL